jgi:hypothetical protein
MAVPVAVKLATVGAVPEQNDCAALPVGAAGAAVTVAVTFSLKALSQVFTV